MLELSVLLPCTKHSLSLANHTYKTRNLTAGGGEGGGVVGWLGGWGDLLLRNHHCCLGYKGEKQVTNYTLSLQCEFETKSRETQT